MRRNKFACEAKTRLDSLLAKKRTKSRQHLVSDDEDTGDEQALPEAVDADVHREEDLSVENKSYIMDKFLNDSGAEKPVPKPRRAKIRSPGAETYTVSPLKPRNDVQEVSAVNTARTRNHDNNRESRTKTRNSRDHHTKTRNHREDDIEMDVIETASNHTFDVNSSADNLTYESETITGKQHETALQSNVDKDVYNYNKIVNVVVHRCDRLLLDSFVVHPVVKVHFVNSETGDYLKKSDRSRNIVFYYESKDIDYIGPVMTQAYNLQENRSLHPNWEESILINEDFKYLSSHHNVLLFFEVMDFLSTNAIKQTNPKGQLGWRKIAWAFLRLTSPTYANLDKRVRLQLYHPANAKKNTRAGKCEIFAWWLKRKFRKYPSTLYVSINGVTSPAAAVETLRSRAPNEIETGNEDFRVDAPKSSNVDKARAENETAEDAVGETAKGFIWERKENQICKLPNKCVQEINAYEEGCFVMSFSHSGLFLACSVGCDDVFIIIIYSVLEKEEVAKMEVHQGLVHAIVWSSNDKIMLTASSDCTVCLWNMESYTFIQMLPHPSFVYACDLHDNNLIATGCYDKFIRLWGIDGDAEYELRDELGEHSGYITSVVFNKTGSLLYSADSTGGINAWKYSEEHWNLRKQIKVLDLKHVVINQILLHRKERKLLVNSRDSKIRLIDIKTGYVLQTYNGAYNIRVYTRCCFTPCGNYILSGSETGELYIWDTETGKIEQTYTPYGHQLDIHCVQYHPKDNYFALSHYGSNLPILLYKYDKDNDDKTSAKQSLHLAQGAVKIDAVRKEALNFREILQKMDHLISPK